MRERGPGLRIGVTQWSVDGRGPETLFRAAALGFDTIHLSSGELDGDLRLDDDAVREAYLRATRESGVAIEAISPGDLNDLGLTSPAGSTNADACRDSIRIAIDAAVDMHVPLVFLPSFRAGEIRDESDLRRTAEVLAEACDLAAGRPLTIATENTLDAEGNLRLLAAAGPSRRCACCSTRRTRRSGGTTSHRWSTSCGRTWRTRSMSRTATTARWATRVLGEGQSGFPEDRAGASGARLPGRAHLRERRTSAIAAPARHATSRP